MSCVTRMILCFALVLSVSTGGMKSQAFAETAPEEATIGDCVKWAGCAAVFTAIAATCATQCFTPAGVFTGGQGCWICIGGLGAETLKDAQDCWALSQKCGELYPIPPTPPLPPLPSCSTNCQDCCRRGAFSACTQPGMPGATQTCLDQNYSLCFKNCNCPGGHDWPINKPPFGGTMGNCYMNKTGSCTPSSTPLPGAPVPVCNTAPAL
jgi:hypothetical protein